MGLKLPLSKWHTFCMAPSLICYLIAILFYIERMWHIMRNLAIILPSKSKLPGKFQFFNTRWKYPKYLQIAEFPKISIEIKNRKTFYKAQTASHLRKFFSLSKPTHPSPHKPPDKVLLRLSKKNFIGRYTEI